jgi:hypothetical protein
MGACRRRKEWRLFGLYPKPLNLHLCVFASRPYADCTTPGTTAATPTRRAATLSTTRQVRHSAAPGQCLTGVRANACWCHGSIVISKVWG